MEWWGNSGLLAPSALWTPALISTALWLDAGDASTITTVSGAVSQWNDKSGNNRHAVQGTAASRPVVTANGLGSKSVITFDGSNDFMDVATTILQGIGVFSLHWIYARLGSGTGTENAYRPAISLLSASGADNGAFHYIKNTSNLGASYPIYHAGPVTWGNYDPISGTTYSNNQANILSFNAGASSWNVFRNGTQEGTAARGGSPGSDFIGFRLAQQANIFRTSNIYIAEIAMTLDAGVFGRQQIEGYLAHKWGLTANLPAGHPYKTSPPYA